MRIRTGYSFRVAVGHLAEVMARLKQCGYPVAPISDRFSTFGFNRWTKLCKKEGLRPIYGVELGVVPNLGEKKPVIDYWTFFAIDSLRPLHDLISLATEQPGREPSISYDMALSAEGLIKIAGERLRVECLPDKPENFYVALSPSMSKGLFNQIKKRKLPLVASSDNVFPCKEDKEFYRVTLGKNANNQTYPQYILTTDEWDDAIDHFADVNNSVKKAMENFNKVANLCHATMRHASLLRPEKPATLRELCIEGAKRTGTNLEDPVYKERLDRELSLIEEKKFEDYFYIIADIVNWAKERMIVGPARGSSCGSLVCYLLNITSIDPIPFGLIFERFIDINRTDLPDIDIDFSDTKRYMVLQYTEDKFGKEHVAKLGTVGIFRPRSALNQAGIALRIPRWLVQKVSDSVIERSGGDSRALQALEDTLKDTDAGKQLQKEFPEVAIAQRMEGHPNNPSQHAAGIVVTEEPINEFVAVDKRTNSVMCDKKDAEDLELLKIDALGLTQLSIFERTMELLGLTPESSWLDKIPIDDPKAFEVLNQNHFAGIFQFNGMSLQSLTKQIKVERLDDIVSITALARPGPISTGGASTWVNRRMNREPITHIHPILADLTKETYGVVVYQETVMNIVRNVGKMSWEDTSTIRKSMSKSLGDEFFEQFWQKFKAGAAENGLEENVASAIWKQVNKFGSWAFNKSHAVAYGMISYWCCWFKAHYPLEFAAATLDAESDPMKQIQILRELKEEGIDYIPVDPQQSTDKWSVGEKNGKQMLLGPLTQIKGIGPASVEAILKARETGEDLKPGLAKKLANAITEIDSLYPIAEAIKRQINGQVQTVPMAIKEVQLGVTGEIVIIGVLKKIAPKDENEAQNIAKRGYKIDSGPTQALNLFTADDTDEIFCKVSRFDYERIAIPIINMGKPGKAIWALKGTVPRGFRMLSVKRAKYIGDLDIDVRGNEIARQSSASDSDPNTNEGKTRQRKIDQNQ